MKNNLKQEKYIAELIGIHQKFRARFSQVKELLRRSRRRYLYRSLAIQRAAGKISPKIRFLSTTLSQALAQKIMRRQARKYAEKRRLDSAQLSHELSFLRSKCLLDLETIHELESTAEKCCLQRSCHR